MAGAAQALRVAANTVSTLVGRLVDAGVIVCEIDERDRRAVRLELAPSVRRRVQLWRDRRVAAVDEALAQLTADERRRLDAARTRLSSAVTGSVTASGTMLRSTAST